MTRTKLLPILLAIFSTLCILLPRTTSSSSTSMKNRVSSLSPRLIAFSRGLGESSLQAKPDDRGVILAADRAAAAPAEDPSYSQSFILTQSTGSAGTTLGAKVSIDDAGDTIAMITSGVNSSAGGVVVFEKQAGTWVDTLEIDPPIVSFNAAVSVAISGDGKTIVVGTCSNAVCLGQALVYEKPGATWTGATLTATLTPSDPLPGARFGLAVAIDQAGDTIAVGAPCESTIANTASEICGAVYVYAKPAGSWMNAQQSAKLTVGQPAAPACPVTPTTGQEFNEVPTLGSSVAIDSAGDVIATGAPDQIGCGPNGPGSQIFVQGAGYVFLKPSSGPWATTTIPNATLLATGGVQGDTLGFSMAVSGDGNTIVAGAPAQISNTNSTIPAGATYVFTVASRTWNGQPAQAAKLTASGAMAGDFLGSAIATTMDGSTIIAASPHHTVTGSGSIAVSYVFLEPSGNWISKTQDQELDPAAGTDINGGSVIPGNACVSLLDPLVSVTPDATTIAMGVCASTVAGHARQGAVFLFALPAAPAAITATSGTPQSAMVNAAFGALLKATVRDASGGPVAGILVTFTPPAQTGPSGTFAGGVSTATTDANGVATSAMFTANGHAGGPYTVTATAAGVATAADFMLTNTSGSAATISATGGTPQSTQINTVFSNKLQATVADGSANPVSGVTVTFTPPAQTGASGTFAGGVDTATTDASGIATSAVFTANGNAGGPYTVTASVAGVTTAANFSLTNTAAAGDFTLTSVSAAPPTTTGSTNSATVTAGSSAMYVFNLTSLNGFNSAVSLSAAFMGTAAAHTSLSFDMTSVTPTASGVQAALTVMTQAREGHSSVVSSSAPLSEVGVILGACIPPLVVFAALFGRRMGRSGLVASAICFGLVIVVISGTACPNGPPRFNRGHGTPAGTYMITVTGSGGTSTPIVHTATVTLVVQ